MATSEGISHGWKRVVGKTDWGPEGVPMCERLVVTNHSADTLIGVKLKVDVVAMRVGEIGHQHESQFELHLDKIRPGDDHPAVTFIVNESPYFLSLRVSGAMGGPIGGKAEELAIHTDIFAPMFLYPPERFEKIDEAAFGPKSA
ncbi:hypothetical protein G7076_02310 [Sphingomonas sp. HDW15A]|uniref:hypothetical protein n=1 Tax=Sphingomonas sp. HDW15A TaxID=2714942 RepID=UPI001407C676|nr:hypothetical protein [Sphingomonas sp. HDW15A]QIK95473.1 hypothetical protein G7076_02310 [Sphingomonas sp. HDW15A]